MYELLGPYMSYAATAGRDSGEYAAWPRCPDPSSASADGAFDFDAKNKKQDSGVKYTLMLQKSTA